MVYFGYHGSKLQMPKARDVKMIMINFMIGAVVEGEGDKIAPFSFNGLTINKSSNHRADRVEWRIHGAWSV